MTEDETWLLIDRVDDFRRARDYENAVDWSMQAIGDLDPDDEKGFATCLTYLSHSLSWADREDEATRWLEDGLKRFPQSDELRRRLATHLWFVLDRAADGLAVIEAAPAIAPDPTLSDEERESRRVGRLENLNMRVRLLTAAGRVAEAVEMVRSIPPLLPPYDRLLGYLFDLPMVRELAQAGARDPAMADIVNRVTEPTFPFEGMKAGQFAALKAYVNSPGAGG